MTVAGGSVLGREAVVQGNRVQISGPEAEPAPHPDPDHGLLPCRVASGENPLEIVADRRSHSAEPSWMVSSGRQRFWCTWNSSRIGRDDCVAIRIRLLVEAPAAAIASLGAIPQSRRRGTPPSRLARNQNRPGRRGARIAGGTTRRASQPVRDRRRTDGSGCLCYRRSKPGLAGYLRDVWKRVRLLPAADPTGLRLR